MTAPILQNMDHMHLTKGNEDLYNLLDRQIRHECKIAAKETMLNGRCSVNEQLAAEYKTNLRHSHIRPVAGKKHGYIKTLYIASKDSYITMEKGNILDRWYK